MTERLGEYSPIKKTNAYKVLWNIPGFSVSAQGVYLSVSKGELQGWVSYYDNQPGVQRVQGDHKIDWVGEIQDPHGSGRVIEVNGIEYKGAGRTSLVRRKIEQEKTALNKNDSRYTFYTDGGLALREAIAEAFGSELLSYLFDREKRVLALVELGIKDPFNTGLKLSNNNVVLLRKKPKRFSQFRLPYLEPLEIENDIKRENPELWSLNRIDLCNGLIKKLARMMAFIWVRRIIFPNNHSDNTAIDGTIFDVPIIGALPDYRDVQTCGDESHLQNIYRWLHEIRETLGVYLLGKLDNSYTDVLVGPVSSFDKALSYHAADLLGLTRKEKAKLRHVDGYAAACDSLRDYLKEGTNKFSPAKYSAKHYFIPDFTVGAVGNDFRHDLSCVFNDHALEGIEHREIIEKWRVIMAHLTNEELAACEARSHAMCKNRSEAINSILKPNTRGWLAHREMFHRHFGDSELAKMFSQALSEFKEQTLPFKSY